MRVRIESRFAAPPERVWEEARKSQLLRYVAAPLLTFDSSAGRAWPELWVEGEFKAGLRLFGSVPLGAQTIRIEIPDAPRGREMWRIRDNGSGTLVRKWDHWVVVERHPDDPHHTLYCDEVEIQAGLLTPVIWAFATVFYRHRQRRWQRLIAADFDYAAAG